MTKLKAHGHRANHLVIIGHPGPESFNAAVANHYVMAVIENGQQAVMRDLYAEGFNPLLSEAERTAPVGYRLASELEDHCKLIGKAQVVMFIYPLWFGTPPAIIKGYVDRVLGAMMRDTQGQPEMPPAGNGKTLAVITTSASTLPWLEQHKIWSALRESFDQYLASVLGFDRTIHHHIEEVVDDLSDERAGEMLDAVERFAADLCVTLK